MSDELTTAAADRHATRRARWHLGAGSAARVGLAQAGVTVVCFAAVGVLCGFLWEALWEPAQGAVVKHVWYPVSWDRAMPAQFEGTAWYVVVGLSAGVVVGGLAAWLLDRAELMTLAAVVVGGLLAAYLMRVVGLHRGPGDPQRIARSAADGTRLPSQLTLASWWLLLVVPGGAMAALGVVFLTVGKRLPKSGNKPPAPAPAQ
jgi:hypothetical protein